MLKKLRFTNAVVYSTNASPWFINATVWFLFTFTCFINAIIGFTNGTRFFIIAIISLIFALILQFNQILKITLLRLKPRKYLKDRSSTYSNFVFYQQSTNSNQILIFNTTHREPIGLKNWSISGIRISIVQHYTPSFC